MYSKLLLIVASIVLALSCVSALDLSFISPTPLEGSTIVDPSAQLVARVVNDTGGALYGLCTMNNDLAAWWTMEANGTIIIDRSGNGHTLNLLSGGYVNVSGMWGSALGTNTLSQHAAYAPGTGALLTDSGFTISFWMNINKNPSLLVHLLNAEGVGNTGWYITLGNATGINPLYQGQTLRLTLGNTTTTSFTQSAQYTFAEGNWYHIAVKYYRGVTYFYINGQLFSASAFPNNFTFVPTNDYGVVVGYSHGFFGKLKGSLDEVALFSRALDDSEITQLYTLSGSVGSRGVSVPFYGFAEGNQQARCMVTSPTSVTQTPVRSFNASRAGPHYMNATYTFDPETNVTTLAAWVERSFYPTSSMSTVQGSAYYRVNGGSWQLIDDSTYEAYTPSAFGGLFGDSLTGQGGFSWPWAFDGYAHTHFLYDGIPKGVGGSRCDQIRTNILTNAPNNSILFLQCGTNDIGQGVSNAAIIGNYTAIFSDLRAKNNSVYLINILPREPQFCANVTQINTWLHDYYVNNNSDELILGFADVYTPFQNATGCTSNRTLMPDVIHPTPFGATLYASTVFSQAFHHLRYGGFFTRFTPQASLPGTNTYDLKWILSTSMGEASEYQWNNAFTLEGASACPIDVDDDGLYPGSTPDGSADVNDLLFFLTAYEAGDLVVDLDDDGDINLSIPDGSLDVNDLLYFLGRFEEGC